MTLIICFEKEQTRPPARTNNAHQIFYLCTRESKTHISAITDSIAIEAVRMEGRTDL